MVWNTTGLGTRLAKRSLAAIAAASLAFGSIPAPALASQSYYEDVNAPTGTAKLAWSVNLGEGVEPNDWGFYNVSDLIIVDDFAYVAVQNVLQCRDLETGEVLSSVQLASPLDYACHMDNLGYTLVVPESNGVFEAFELDGPNMQKLWGTEALAEGHQNAGYLAFSQDGKYVLGCTARYGADYTIEAGKLVCINLADGSVAWSHDAENTGYYWCGAAVVGDYVFIAPDSGVMEALKLSDGSKVDWFAYDLGGGVASPLQVIQASDSTCILLAELRNGKLVKIELDLAKESNESVVEYSFGDYSVGKANYVDNGDTVLVGGKANGNGLLAMVDLSHFIAPRATIDECTDGSKLPGSIDGTPAFVMGQDAIDVFFTSNALPGALYSVHLDNNTEDFKATVMFAPADESQQNYCQSTPVLDNRGAVYYRNDSATLFKLVNTTYRWKRNAAGEWCAVDGRGSAIAAGWFKTGGKWYYAEGENGEVAYGWRKIDGKWYFFGSSEDCSMQRGWVKDNGAWYYLDWDGSMHRGWLKDSDGSWYYLYYSTGKMARNTVIDGYRIGWDGRWVR